MPSFSTSLPDLHQAHSLLNQTILDFLETQQERFLQSPYLEPICYDLCEYVSRKGKRVRPLLFLTSHHALGGTRPLNDPSLLLAATSLELLHAFILMHDDVIDRSEKRRGLPTFHKLMEARLNHLDDTQRIGQNIAIVAGDILFSLAIEAFHSSGFPANVQKPALSKFLQYVVDTGSGEILDILLGFRDITRVTSDDISEMYHLKTTRYTFEAPMVLGAMLAGAAPEKTEALARASRPLGLAFQIQNDLLEFSHFDSGDLLLQSDLLEGKKTLLLRHAYENLDEVERSFLQMCIASRTRSEPTILKIRELIQQAGSVQHLQNVSQELFRQSEDILLGKPFTHGETSALLEMIGIVKQQVRVQV